MKPIVKLIKYRFDSTPEITESEARRFAAEAAETFSEGLAVDGPWGRALTMNEAERYEIRAQILSLRAAVRQLQGLLKEGSE